MQHYLMGITKTKALLIDVARQLFAKKGVENTTMNDIAKASRKGRRTLYTYFKNKEELYMAVVKSELEILWERLQRVAERDTPPEKKIIEVILTRLEAVKEIVYRNGTLRASFFRDIWSVEKVRKRFDSKEIQLLRDILLEGVEKNVFTISDVDMTAALLHYSLKGVEVPFIRGQIGVNMDAKSKKRLVTEIIFGALQKNNTNNNK